MKTLQKGFSIIEVIIATALFISFATAAVVAVISAFNANRLGAEVTTGNQFTSQGLEAVRSIKNQSWATFAAKADTGNTGVGMIGGLWVFDSAPDTLPSDPRFSRTIAITSVQRDDNGNIVTSGGTNDPNTKKVTATTSWNFTNARPESVILSDYLTNWEATVSAGLMIYDDSTSVAHPKSRLYNNTNGTFTAEADTGNSFTDVAAGKVFKIKTSPTKTEAIAGYVNASGVLRVLCYDGISWKSEWTATVGGTGTNDMRFGIAYEQTTGDAMVVYSTNTGAANEMAYRVKPGSSTCGSANWPAATNISTVRTTGIVQWIRMESSPVAGSNNIALAWADANSDLSAMIWTGSSWAIAEPTAALETNLEKVTTSQDVQSFDMAYESTSGNLMIVWGLSQATTCTAGTTIAATNCIRYARYTGSWSAVAAIPTVADPATNIDISSNPNSNELVLGALDDNQNDLSIAYWSGSTWTGTANVDTSTAVAVAGSKLVATGWLINGATTRYIVIYNDSAATNIGWYVGNAAGAPALQGDFTTTPVLGNPQKWYDIQSDPKNKDRLLFSVSDTNSDLFAKRLVMTATPAFTWTNSDGGVAIEPSLLQALPAPFAYAYWRN